MPAVYRDEIRVELLGGPEVMAALAKVEPDLRIAVKDTIARLLPVAQNEAVEQILNRYYISRPSLMNQSSRHGRWKFKPKYPTEGDLRGGIRVTGTRMPIMRFDVTPTAVPNQAGIPVGARTPVAIRVVRGGGAQIGKPNVFLAKMRTGHVGIYRRKTPNPGGPRKMRPDGQPTQLPISEEYMLSVPEMLQGKKLREKYDTNLNKFAKVIFMQEFEKVPRKAWIRVKAVLANMFNKFGWR